MAKFKIQIEQTVTMKKRFIVEAPSRAAAEGSLKDIWRAAKDEQFEIYEEDKSSVLWQVDPSEEDFGEDPDFTTDSDGNLVD